MGLLAHDSRHRSALLVCDDCDHFYCKGERSERARRDSSPEDLAPCFAAPEDLPAEAVRAGWAASIGPEQVRARWSCPECARALAQTSRSPSEPPKRE